MISSSPLFLLPRLGIDISKLAFDVHLCMPNGRAHSSKFANKKIGFAQLDAWLAQHRASQTRAGLEATGLLLVRSGAIMHKIMCVAFGVLKHETPCVKSFAKVEA